MKRFSFVLVAAAMLFTISCEKNENGKGNGNGKDPKDPADVTEINIEIDGDFADWLALPATAYAKAETDPDAPWTAVDEIRVCADPDYVYYYIRFNNDEGEILRENDEMPIRLCINTDGEFTTGYANYFQEAYDFIVEGNLSDGAGKWTEYKGTMHQRLTSGWKELLKPESGVVTGAGKDLEYEICLDRGIFSSGVQLETGPEKNMAIGDVFHTGIRFYTLQWNEAKAKYEWEELSNMPNDSEDDHYWGPLLEVKTIGK